MKRFKQILAVALCAILSVSLAAAAFAANGQKTYLVLGDSIGYGAGISNPEQANYGRIIADTNGYSYINNAVNGFTSNDLLARVKDDRYIPNVAAADIISISIGGNDFLRSNFSSLISQGQSGDYSEFDRIVAHFSGNLEKIVTQIRALNPDALVLFQTLYNPAPSAELKAVYAEGLSRLNGAIVSYAQAHPGAYEIVDVAAYVNAKTGQIAYDNIHPSAAGNVTIAQAIQDKLVELGAAQTDSLVIKTAGRDWFPVSSGSFLARIRAFFQRILAFFRSLF